VSSDVLHGRVRLHAITDAAAWVLAFALAFLMPGRVHQDIASDPSVGIASNNSAARPQPRVTGQAGAGVDADADQDRIAAVKADDAPGMPDARSRSPETASPLVFDEVAQYLWAVYQRSPVKYDGHGEFTWKDIIAAERLGMSVQDYVIGGMDPDFREQLYRVGHSMDAAGVPWTILSGFRDDYRQGLASGLKAHPGRSFHGGSISTGGYGHGCAADLAGIDRGSNEAVWQWLGAHAAQFGLQQPLARIDPAHVQPRGTWHAFAAALRQDRMQTDENSNQAGSSVGAGEHVIAAGLPTDFERELVGRREAACTHARLPPDEAKPGDPPPTLRVLRKPLVALASRVNVSGRRPNSKSTPGSAKAMKPRKAGIAKLAANSAARANGHHPAPAGAHRGGRRAT